MCPETNASIAKLVSEEIAKLGLVRRIQNLEEENIQLKDDANRLEDEIQKLKGVNEKLTESNEQLTESVRGQRWIQAIHGWPGPCMDGLASTVGLAMAGHPWIHGWPAYHFSTSTDGPGHP